MFTNVINFLFQKEPLDLVFFLFSFDGTFHLVFKWFFGFLKPLILVIFINNLE